MMLRWVLIFVGGGGGALLRYALAGWVQRLTKEAFPVGTLVVNLVGCAAIGFLATLLTGPLMVREEYRVALLVGLLGGFTTFSSFAWESLNLATEGEWSMAAVNVVASNLLGLTVAWLAARFAMNWYGP